MSNTLIIAHRGASAYEIENTLKAFTKAIELGADMIEFDIRKTKDNVMVCHHDETERVSNKYLKELEYKEINDIYKASGFRIPTFEEVLILAKGKINLDIELKEVGYEKEVIDLALKYFKEEHFVITSFNDISVKTIKEKYPKIKVGLLLGKKEATIWTRITELFPGRRYKRAMADFIAPNHRLLIFGFLYRAKMNKKPVYVWSIEDEKLIKKLFKKGIAGIITKMPDLAIKIREETN